MSDIKGEGHGSAHNWRYGGSNNSKCSWYTCRTCNAAFSHMYDETPDIFLAMKLWGVPLECAPTDPSGAKE